MTTKRALIVDDSKTAQYRLKKLLRGYQLDIVTVDSAEAALSYLASSVPDVVFMDHLMPGMDGFRALQIIKSHPATATVPVIMYTSKSGDLYTSEARALGALDVVSKDSITAADLRQVLKAIHIYPQDTGPGHPSTETDTKAPASEPSTSQTTESQASNSTSSTQPEAMLSVELRLRELEHTIDDNRRIITSRLVREMQGIRHDVRKLTEQIPALKSQKEGTNEPDRETETFDSTPWPDGDNHRRGSWWAKAALILVGLILGSKLYFWGSDIGEQLTQIAQTQSAIIEHTDQLTEQIFAGGPARTEEQKSPAVERPGRLRLLPELTWALNQNSVQEFHSELVNPKLTRQVTELASRLSARNFQGRLEVAIQGGDFCVVTSPSGEPQLPKPDSRLADCTLLSELYGTDATEQVTEQLRFALAESASLDSQPISIEIESFNREFAPYPEFRPQTPVREWNRAARQNNRVLINVKPATRSQAARNDRAP